MKRISPPALKLPSDIPRDPDNPFVIACAKLGTHLVNMKDSWAAIRDVVNLPDLRIHDLRHSFASIGAGGGMSLPVIGALLGHRRFDDCTIRAHLSDDPLRVAVEAIGDRIDGVMNTASFT